MLWISTLRPIKIIFYHLYSSQKWQCVLSMFTFVNKSVEKKTVKFTVSPTHSMLLFKGCGFECERDTDRHNFQAPLSNMLHRIKMLLHQLVPRSRYLVIFYCILPGPVHDNRTKEATASKFKEVYNIPYTSVVEWAFNRRCCDFKVLISSGIHSFICSNTQTWNLVHLTHE